MKTLLRSSMLQAIAGALIAGYMSLVKNTTRWEVRGRDVIQPIWDRQQGLIGCVWHARILMTMADWPKSAQEPGIIISRSADGEFVAQAARRLGVNVIRGSARNPRKAANKGGVTAFRAMLEHVNSGGCMAITPDGPRGPRMRASLGAVRLARATGAPMIAFAWSTRWRIVFQSWDRFVLPLPFSRGVIVWKGPIAAPPKDTPGAVEAARSELEAALIAANQEADAAMGVEIIEPEPRPETADAPA